MNHRLIKIHTLHVVLSATLLLTMHHKSMAQDMPATKTKSDPTSIRNAACTSMQADFDRIVGANSRDPATQEVLARLTALDETSREILRQIAKYKTAFLNRSLATVSEVGDQVETKAGIESLKLLESKLASWPTRKGITKLSQADQNLLQAYYNTSALAVTQLIQTRAQACIANTTEATSEVVRLAMIVPLLATTDDNWASIKDQVLPAWMKKAEYIRALENMCLRSQRPRSAYAIVNSEKNSATTAPSDAAEYAGYLRSGANAMLRERQYLTATTYLRHACTIATTLKNIELLGDLRFQLAEVAASTDSPQAGGDEVRHIMEDSLLAQFYGKAAMLRLKYLYQANQSAQVLEEAKKYSSDPRCASYLPQITYIAWVTARKVQSPDAEINYWQNSFLTQFPDHPLGADIYFAGAMKALAASEYQEALRLFRFIEYRYPNARIIEKVREMKGRIESANSEQTTTRTSKR